MGRPANTNERQAQIARALLHVMAKRGYDGATLADVAKEADIAPGLVHYHFKNKLEILLSAIAELAADYEARLAQHLEEAGDDVIAQLRAFIDAHLRVGAAADPAALACWINISGEALREPRVRKAFTRVLSGSVARVRAILDRGTTEGVFSCSDTDAAAAAIVATIQGYFVLAATARDLVPASSAAPATWTMARALLALPAKAASRRRSPS